VSIRAVLFDIGGVLEHTPRTGWLERWAERLSLSPAEMARRLDPIWIPGETGHTTLARVEQETARVCGLSAPQLQAFMHDAWSEYLGTLNDELTAYVATLRPRYRTGIVSNSFVGAREREQAAYGLAELCDVLIYSHEVGWAKPDPRIYRLACERLAVEAQEAVFVDDLSANVEAARGLGMHAILFRENRQLIDELEPVGRQLYGGTVGYFGQHGDMDQAITIRTLVFRGDTYSYQAGGGIVADSSPQAGEHSPRGYLPIYGGEPAPDAIGGGRAPARSEGLRTVEPPCERVHPRSRRSRA